MTFGGCYADHGLGVSGPEPAEDPICGPPDGMVCCGPGGLPYTSIGCPFQCPYELVVAGACVATRPTRPEGPDAGVDNRCPIERAEISCSDAEVVEAGLPFRLTVEFNSVVCSAQAECFVSVDRERRTIDLTTARCPDLDACVGMLRGPVGYCEVPALEAGQWTVNVNGSPAFTQSVAVEPEPSLSGCVGYAEEDSCSSEVLPGNRRLADRVCLAVPPFIGLGPQLTVHYDCPGCRMRMGSCRALVEERTDRLNPPGADIHLSPYTFQSECMDGDCPAVCVPKERLCPLPVDLDPDGFYRVFIDGLLVHSFTPSLIEPGHQECSSIDLPVPG